MIQAGWCELPKPPDSLKVHTLTAFNSQVSSLKQRISFDPDRQMAELVIPHANLGRGVLT